MTPVNEPVRALQFFLWTTVTVVAVHVVCVFSNVTERTPLASMALAVPPLATVYGQDWLPPEKRSYWMTASLGAFTVGVLAWPDFFNGSNGFWAWLYLLVSATPFATEIQAARERNWQALVLDRLSRSTEEIE